MYTQGPKYHRFLCLHAELRERVDIPGVYIVLGLWCLMRFEGDLPRTALTTRNLPEDLHSVTQSTQSGYCAKGFDEIRKELGNYPHRIYVSVDYFNIVY